MALKVFAESDLRSGAVETESMAGFGGPESLVKSKETLGSFLEARSDGV